MRAYKLSIFVFFAMRALVSAHLGKALIRMLKDVEDPEPELAMNMVKWRLLMEKQLREKVPGATDLHVALKFGIEDIALELIKNSADVNIKEDYFWNTPLHVAANRNFKTCVEELIKRGAFLESKNASGSTPLFYAIWNATYLTKADVVKVLLDAGADPHAEYKCGNSIVKPLHCAAWNANAPIVELLLSRGVDANEIHINGQGDLMRPLDYVMLERCPEQKTAVIVFLNNGAEQTDRNSFESVLMKFWNWSRGETFEGFDDYILRNIEENSPCEDDADVPPHPVAMAERFFLSVITKICCFSPNPKGKIWDLVKKFDEEGMFALYRILKWSYVETCRGKRQSNLERDMFDIFDHILTGMFENTYLGKMPVEIAADAFSFAAVYYRWKVERYAFNFALAAHYLKLNVREVKDAAFELFFNSEAAQVPTCFCARERHELREKD